MRSRRLEIALTVYLEEAAIALQGLIAAGAEVPIEIVAQPSRRGQAPLYSYRPLTWRFIREHARALARMHTHDQLVAELAHFGGLERYLRSRAPDGSPADAEGQARAALGFVLEDVFADQTDFKLRPERLQRAIALLDGTSEAPGEGRLTMIATLHGVALSTSEMVLAPGLSLARPQAVHGLPEELAGEEGGSQEQLLVVYASERGRGAASVAEGRELLRELLRALRLFGDGRVTLGGLAWTRVAGARWRPIALSGGGRPQGRLLLTGDQEDGLRAVYELLSRGAPAASGAAWALERFELGCDRAAPVQALSDYVLALRALLAGGPPDDCADAPDELLARRLAVLCAAPAERAQLAERTRLALALERSIRAQGRLADVRQEGLVRELGEHLRVLLREVVCGQLDGNLAGMADALIEQAMARTGARSPAGDTATPRAEQLPTSIVRARTTRQRVRTDQEETLVRRAPRKSRAAGAR